MDDPLEAAFDRLDRAIARAEAAGRAVAAGPRGLAEAYAHLEERHGLLRLRIQETIERLDGMIAGGGDTVGGDTGGAA